MPQLDPSSYASQIFWLILCFTILYLVVSLFIAPKMDKLIQQRENIVDKHISQANLFKEEADRIFKTYELAINEAKQNAIEVQNKNMEELDIFIKSKNEEAQATLMNQADGLRKALEEGKKEALNKINEAAKDIANEVISKIGLTKA